MQEKTKGKAKPSRSAKNPRAKKENAASADANNGAIAQLAALLLQHMQGALVSEPEQPEYVEPVEIQTPVRAEDFGFDAEQSLFPGATEFSDEVDARNFANSIGFGSQNWNSVHNPDFTEIDNGGPFLRKVREDIMSIQGQTEAKFEMMSNRIRQIERYIGQQAAHQVSARGGRR